MKLRDYQEQAIATVVENAKESNKLLLSMATGLGKTVVFTTLAKRHFLHNNKKVLIIAHSEELLEQAKEKFEMVDPDVFVVIDQGAKKLNQIKYENAQVIVASVQTLGRKDTKRLDLYNPNDFSLIICDETHKILASSYVRILEHFGVSKHPASKDDKEAYEEYVKFKGSSSRDVEWVNGKYDWNKSCILLGVTATPMRTKQGETLKFIFDRLIYKYDLTDGIKDGYLCNIHSLVARTKTSLDGITRKGNDYNTKELSDRINTDVRNEFVVATYLEKAQQGATLCFSASLEHNEALKQKFIEKGVQAETIDGGTPKELRRNIIERFKNNEIPVLINVGVLTTGFDAPNIMNILMCRPTQSTILYLQCLGRGTRLYEGKEKVTVIDFVDNVSKHNPMTLKYILGIPEGKEVARKPIEEMEDLKEELEDIEESGGDVLQQLAFGDEYDNREYEIIDKGLIMQITRYVKENFLEKSKFTWLKIFENEWFLPLPNYQEYNTLKGKLKFYQSRLKLKEEWEEWQLYFEGIQMNRKKVTQLIGKYQLINHIDDRVKGLALDNGIETMFLLRNQKWHKDPISQPQKEFITRLLNLYQGQKTIQITPEDLKDLDKGSAGLLINILKYQTKS